MYLPPRIYGQFMCTRCRREKEFLDWDVEPHGEPVIDNACYCGGSYEATVECPECKQVFSESKLVDYEGEQVCETCREMLEAENELEELLTVSLSA